MIVLIEEIGDNGLALEKELTSDFLAGVFSAEGSDTGFAAAAPGKLKARFDRVGDKILLRGEAAVRLTGRCRRCLAEAAVDLPVEFALSLVARPSEVGGGGAEGEAGERRDEEGGAGSFDLASADEEAFDGRQIDLGAIVREQILLALPMDTLCKEDCKGLCTVCGQDLNVASCHCERKVMDPRWAALKDIKL